jgi:single-strand DNA-binding protein
MSQEAFATVAGYATADPIFRLTKGGVELAHVRVACTPRRLNHGSGEWEDGDTSYFSVTCWRKLATAVRASIRKGDPVLVRGRMRTRSWKSDDRTVSEVEIDADAMGHDLTRGWATFNRGMRPPVEQAGAGEEARQASGEGVGEGAGASADGGGRGRRDGDGDGHDERTEDERTEEGYEDPDDPGTGAGAGAGAGDVGPWEPVTPAASEGADDILTESAVADLSVSG